MTINIEPTAEYISKEYVLVQAWKKASSFIRYHNWFADHLELDKVAANLPEFLASLAQDLASGPWKSDPLRIVPAPKSQDWYIAADGAWLPKKANTTSSRIRPLAHVSLRDQVATTAAMLCLADRVETAQGDPRRTAATHGSDATISYGNRLLCDSISGSLRHRWASSKLYRQYFEDYRTFLASPEDIGLRLTSGEEGVYVVQADLRQFYDRVSPASLHHQLRGYQRSAAEDPFFDLVAEMFDWKWATADSTEVQIYASEAGLGEFDRVALPQGLVAAGFFANVALTSFDAALRSSIDAEIRGGLVLRSAARYVDDLRLVITSDVGTDLDLVRVGIVEWLTETLATWSPGLSLNEAKTVATSFKGDERPIVPQSRKMERIQTAVSGGFDVSGGGEILDAIAGLIRSQRRFAESKGDEASHTFLPIPDVRDSTVDRFAAARFRSTYRSLRPLLWEEETVPDEENEDGLPFSRWTRTQAELDDEARAFALGLIDQWVHDPSNVRLLRIGLDIWPAVDVLDRVLALIRPFTDKGGLRKAPCRVAWYCLAEIFRAGATETGIVSDGEALSGGVDLVAYRNRLRQEAVRIVSDTKRKLPWYLKQQAYLVIAANQRAVPWIPPRGKDEALKHYRELIRYLGGNAEGLTTVDYAAYAIISRRSFLEADRAADLAASYMTQARLSRIALQDPAFAKEIMVRNASLSAMLTIRAAEEIGYNQYESDNSTALSAKEQRRSLRNEVSVLSFSIAFLRKIQEAGGTPLESSILPRDVMIELANSEPGRFRNVQAVNIEWRRGTRSTLYDPPSWCSQGDHWRFHLGYLLRYILTENEDFTLSLTHEWRSELPVYRPVLSHWYQRLYGLYNGNRAFDEWLPVTEWTEKLLYALLSWPGCLLTEMERSLIASIDDALRFLEARHAYLTKLAGSSVDLLPLEVVPVVRLTKDRPLRACIVQTVYPDPDCDFDHTDLAFASLGARTKHRRHLSASLAGVRAMLSLRETHKGRDGRLDLLVFPELSVHPQDIHTHLVPFARQYKTIIVAGMTYNAKGSRSDLVNSAVWIVPTRSGAAGGMSVIVVRQGKKHLAPNERYWESLGLVRGDRDCQWLLGYRWSPSPDDPLLWLTASICYDATDIGLAADLKDHSDVFIVPALNKDVGTFDQMALALHYHMFQMVVIANNGRYGGSNAYAPYKESWHRQIFHVHGQPQASVSFLEIDFIRSFLDRKVVGLPPSAPPPPGSPPTGYKFKEKPAGA